MRDLFKDGFQSSDFFKVQPNYPDEDTSDWAARVANQLLREALEKAAKVYIQHGFPIWPQSKDETETHTARLVCIEEVEK